MPSTNKTGDVCPLNSIRADFKLSFQPGITSSRYCNSSASSVRQRTKRCTAFSASRSRRNAIVPIRLHTLTNVGLVSSCRSLSAASTLGRSHGFAALSRQNDSALEGVHLEGRLWHISPQAPPEPFHRMREVRPHDGPAPGYPLMVGLRYAAISFCDRLRSCHRCGGGRACAVCAILAQLAHARRPRWRTNSPPMGWL